APDSSCPYSFSPGVPAYRGDKQPSYRRSQRCPRIPEVEGQVEVVSARDDEIAHATAGLSHRGDELRVLPGELRGLVLPARDDQRWQTGQGKMLGTAGECGVDVESERGVHVGPANRVEVVDAAEQHRPGDRLRRSHSFPPPADLVEQGHGDQVRTRGT